MLKIYALLICFSISINTWAQTSTDSTVITKRVFKLGEIIVNAKSTNESNTVKTEKIEAFNKLDVANALNLLPGVNLSKVGARNETVVFIRGFDLRQTPLFIDGIPVYVPYDGYVDLGRFTTFDVSQINVSKGFSSVIYGANTMGGAINIVSRKPVEKLEIDARTGLMSGDGHHLNLNMGSKIDRFYIQGSISQLKQDAFPLSKDFNPKTYEDGGERDNAYRKDNKYALKFGFTPNKNDEYAISYTNQQGEKGNPPYVGDDTQQKTRFWQWPYWNKESVYFISNTSINAKSAVKTRLFYDNFRNLLSAYDDNKYTTQTKASAFNSYYNDDTYGAAIIYQNQFSEKNLLKTTVQYKNDRHKEYNAGEPERTFNDYTGSFGIEDNFQISKKLTLLPGASLNLRHSLKAQDYNSTTKVITDIPENENYAFNVQLGAVYQLNDFQTFNVSVAQKSRFATIKDRYSYRMGAAIPNPDLKAEAATHYELGYAATFKKLSINANLFYSAISDAIQQVNNVQPGIFQLQNTGKAEFYGSELALNYTILKGWNADAQYSYLRRTNLSNKALKFTDAPDHKVLISSSYNFKNKASIMANTEYNSDRYSTSYGIKSKEFMLVNSSAKVKIYKRLCLEGGLNNIFDKNYTLSEGFPEAGRNYFFSLSFNNL